MVFLGRDWCAPKKDLKLLTPKHHEMLNKIAIFLSSLFISIILEIILIAFTGMIQGNSMMWAIVVYPLIFISVFITLHKTYANKDYNETNINYSSIKLRWINIIELHSRNDEYHVSTRYLKKIKIKIFTELLILSPIFLFVIMLFLSESESSKLKIIPTALILAVPLLVTLSGGRQIFFYYKILFKEASERKIIFNKNTIQVFNTNDNLKIINLQDIHTIKVSRDKKSNLIDWIQLFIIKEGGINSDIKLEGYNDMDIFLKQLIPSQESCTTGKTGDLLA
jgi:hypothetical protein